jgi:hypothetical protein
MLWGPHFPGLKLSHQSKLKCKFGLTQLQDESSITPTCLTFDFKHCAQDPEAREPLTDEAAGPLLAAIKNALA